MSIIYYMHVCTLHAYSTDRGQKRETARPPPSAPVGDFFPKAPVSEESETFTVRAQNGAGTEVG